MMNLKQIIGFIELFGGVAILTTNNIIECSFNSELAKTEFLQSETCQEIAEQYNLDCFVL